MCGPGCSRAGTPAWPTISAFWRRRTGAVWREALEHVDALLTPTTPIAAPPLEEVDETAFTLARFTRAGNYLDWCATALPMGADADGLPLSLQIAAPAFEESRVLRLAAAYQGATGHHRRQLPPA